VLVRRFSGSQKTVFNDEQFKGRELITLIRLINKKQVKFILVLLSLKIAVDIFSLVGYFRWETGTEQ